MKIMEGRTIVLTGVTSGIGKELLKICLQSGMKPVVIARNEIRLKQLLDELKELGLSDGMPCYITDLSILENVLIVGKEIAKKNPVVDLLVNNAGAYLETHKVTKEGHELTLAINHLSPVLLSILLLPSLNSSTDGRILNVSSSAHLGGIIHWDKFQIKKKNYGFPAYNQSKLLLLMFSKELARKLKKTSIKVNAIHPGIVKTNLGRDRVGNGIKKHNSMMSYWVNRLGITSHQSAESLFNVLTDPKFKNVTGKYFSRDKMSFSLSRNQKKQRRVWDITLSLLIDTLGNNIQEKIKKNLEIV